MSKWLGAIAAVMALAGGGPAPKGRKKERQPVSPTKYDAERIARAEEKRRRKAFRRKAA